MSERRIERRQQLSLPVTEVFEFFGDARNLEAITPPFLRFRVVTRVPIEMREGALIEYRLRMHGVPVRWRTEISAWEPGKRFVDEQISGPFSLWHHTHTFEPGARGEGTVMRDVVRYRMPLGPLGEIARRVLIGRDLEKIFDYRAERIPALLALPAPQ